MHISYLVPGAAVLLAGVSIAARPTRSAAAIEPATIQVQGLSGNIEHGNYIVHDIAMCFECHSPRDADGNILQSQEFDGAPIPVRPPWGDWALIAPRNKGLPGYDDAQAMRLLTEGAIGRDGKQLRPPMPRFHMNKQDAADVIAYMRSVK
jgi:mono/diheme cytochrome c family protein